VRGEGKRDPRPADSPGRLRQQANARKQSANLIPFLPGQTGNPEGKNGAKWLSEFRRFFDAKGNNDQSRFHNVCQKLYANAIIGSDAAIKTIIEHMKGLASRDISEIEWAEYFRKVEKDRIEYEELAELRSKLLAVEAQLAANAKAGT
jgi:hypothetical protein